MTPLADILPPELTAIRAAGLVLAALVAGFAIWRRHSLRNADVLILLLIALGLAIVAGTEIPDALLSAFAFERQNGTRIIGVAIFAILILFALVVRSLAAELAGQPSALGRARGPRLGGVPRRGTPGALRGPDRRPRSRLQRGRQRRHGARPDPGRGLRAARPRSWSSTTARATAPTRSRARTARSSPAMWSTAAAALRCAPAIGCWPTPVRRSSSPSTPTASISPRRWSDWSSPSSAARWRSRTARACSARPSATTPPARPGSSSSTGWSR